MAGRPTSDALAAGAFIIGVLATMIATWSFSRVQPAWGVYNIAIALVALLTFIAIRAHRNEA